MYSWGVEGGWEWGGSRDGRKRLDKKMGKKEKFMF